MKGNDKEQQQPNSSTNNNNDVEAFYNGEDVELDYYGGLELYFRGTTATSTPTATNNTSKEDYSFAFNEDFHLRDKLNAFFDIPGVEDSITSINSEEQKFIEIPELATFFETSPSRMDSTTAPDHISATGNASFWKGASSKDKTTEIYHSLLIRNRRYQQLLREQLALVEDARRKLQEHLRTLRSIHGSVLRPRMRTNSKAIRLATKIEERINVLSQTAESVTLARSMAMYRDWLGIASSKWSSKEESKLREGLVHECRRIQLEHEPDALINDNTDELLLRMFTGIDWHKVSAAFVPTRTPLDCRLYWSNQLHPLIDRKPFSKEELSTLGDLVDKKWGIQGKWTEVAQELSSQRTAWQCLMEYRRGRGRHHYHQEATATPRKRVQGLGRKWTPQEDQILLECRRLFGSSSDWWVEAIDRLAPSGRTASQVLHRWSKNLNPEKRIGRWTPQEDAWLLMAINRLPKSSLEGEDEKKIGNRINWSLISAFVPRRTDVQCRERYMNVLHPLVRKDDFSSHEDSLLRRAIKEFGEGNWAVIQAQYFPDRTDNQCRRRWKALLMADGLQAASTSSTRQSATLRKDSMASEKPTSMEDSSLNVKEAIRKRRSVNPRKSSSIKKTTGKHSVISEKSPNVDESMATTKTPTAAKRQAIRSATTDKPKTTQKPMVESKAGESSPTRQISTTEKPNRSKTAGKAANTKQSTTTPSVKQSNDTSTSQSTPTFPTKRRSKRTGLTIPRYNQKSIKTTDTTKSPK